MASSADTTLVSPRPHLMFHWSVELGVMHATRCSYSDDMSKV